MAVWKKNQMNQILFTMVDKTDFATIESGLTSNFTVSVFGVDNGGSAAASDVTLSKSVSVVKSGVYKITAKAAETNWDYLMLKITHASAADQMIPIQTVTNDDDDIHSKIVLVQSNMSNVESQLDITASKVLLIQSNVSDVESQLDVTASKVLLIQSNVSDIDSQLLLNASMISDVMSAADSQALLGDSRFSDIMSNIDAVTASIDASDISDIASRVWSEKWRVHSLASSFGSLFSVVGTNTDNAASRALLNQSAISDVESQLDITASKVLLIQSNVSDIESAADSQALLGDSRFSDLMSNIDAVNATITPSDMSDIASRVWATAEGTRVDSRILVIQSMVSDVDSQLLLNASMISDVQSALDSQALLDTSRFSDIMSNIDAVTATIAGSDISAIADQVWNEPYSDHVAASTFGKYQSNIHSKILTYPAQLSGLMSDVQSQVDVNASTLTSLLSRISDVESALDSQFAAGVPLTASDMSDIRSAISAGPGATVTASDISDIASAVQAIQASRLSDILSAAVQTNSRVALVQSNVSDIQSAADSQALLGDSRFSDLMSNIDAVTASVSPSDISDIASAVQAIQASRMSDILSAAQQASSRTLVVQSMVSDVDSQLLVTDGTVVTVKSLVSDVDSQINAGVPIIASDMSDLRSAITAGPTDVTIGASSLSDIRSAITAANNASLISDIDSQLTITASKVVLIQSNVSDIESQIDAGVTIGASSLSDISSRVNVEVADVMKTDTIAQLASQVPPATPTFEEAQMYLYQYFRNKREETASRIVMYDDAGTSKITSAVISDDATTFTKEEFG
jgi:hypothetical protein